MGLCNTKQKPINEEGQVRKPVNAEEGQQKSQDDRLDTFKNIITDLKISNINAAKLRALDDFKIVFYINDTLAMNDDAQPKKYVSDPFAKFNSHFEDLKYVMNYLVGISTSLSKDDVEIRFENHGGNHGMRYTSVTNFKQVESIFDKKPTSAKMIKLHEKIENIAWTMNSVLDQKKLLVICATPPKFYIHNELLNFIKTHPTLHLMFINCSSDTTHFCFDGWAKNARVGVAYPIDTEREKYHSEKEGEYTLGDYILKILLGAVDSDIKNG